MTGNERSAHDPASTERLIAAVRATGPDEDAQLRGWLATLTAELRVPVEGVVLGTRVELLAVEYAGQPRRGLTARCRGGGHEYRVSLADVILPAGVPGAGAVAAYRHWLGLVPESAPSLAPARPGRRPKAADEDLPLDRAVELGVWAVKDGAARCRLAGTGREVTLRSTGLWRVVPGELLTVRPTRRWRYAGHPYLSAAIERCRLDVPALGLTPLRLRREGRWDPAEQYWGEPEERLEDWVEPLVARGPRPMFEMEQVLPGTDPNDPDADPIVEASQRHEGGDPVGARQILMALLAQDLRCLDAHAHLGNFCLEHDAEEARRHYEVGVKIAELTLGSAFDGVLSWGWTDNRPFLRCLHGLGLSLWQLARMGEAAAVFERILWLNPGDNQGARFCRAAVLAGRRRDEAGDAG